MPSRGNSDAYREEVQNLKDVADQQKQAAQAADQHRTSLESLTRGMALAGTGVTQYSRMLEGFVQFGNQFPPALQAAAASLQNLGLVSEVAFSNLERGFAASLAAAMVYGTSFAASMEMVLKQLAASISAEAELQAVKATALGFLRLAELNFPAAAAAFTSAAEWAVVGGAAGMAGGAISVASSGAASGQLGPRSSRSVTATGGDVAAAQPVLASGVTGALNAPSGSVTILVGSNDAELARYVGELVNTHVSNGGKVTSSHTLRPAFAGS
ncbi:MAG: hypothetical protein ACRD2O_03725 [Terriglobia bacterium]